MKKMSQDAMFAKIVDALFSIATDKQVAVASRLDALRMLTELEYDAG